MKQSKNLTTGTMGTAVKDHLLTAYNVVATPRLIADWNYNRYANTVEAKNEALDNPESAPHYEDSVNFPIDSIIEPLRPGKGVLKARVGESMVSSKYNNPKGPKFYVGDPEDNYKYWVSPYPTDTNGNFSTNQQVGGTFYGQTVVQPTVYYNTVLANKIVIRIDNTWATPKTYDVQVQNTSDAWITVAGSNPAMDLSTGLLTLYYNGTAWVTTRPSAPVLTQIKGVRFRVSAMKEGYNRDGTVTKYRTQYASAYGGNSSSAYRDTDGKNSSLSLIAIEAHMEVDLSDRLIDCDDQFDYGEVSQLYPVGTITSNQASFNLDNTDGIFDYENTSSPYYRKLDKNVECNLEYIYTIGADLHSVQQWKMYTEGWAVSEDGQVSVELLDYSKFLRDIKPSPMMYENVPTTQLIWRVLDSVGFVDYEVQKDDLTGDHKIPVFWTTGEETVWEVLDGLAQATQTSIYFDSYGKLQVRTREAAFNAAKNPDWTIRSQDNGTTLADLVSLDQTQEFEANKVKVTYKTTNWKLGTDGRPAMSIVWEPEGDLVVRSTPLKSDMGTENTGWLHLGMPEASYWPYESVVEIDGELMKYKGKHFVYYTGASGETKNTVKILSQDEYTKYNEMTLPDYRYKNNFSGRVWVTQRGIWGTDKSAHTTGANNWRTKLITNDQTSPTTYTNVSGFKEANSTVAIIQHPKMNGPNDLYFASRDYPTNSGYKMQGTRIFFAPGYKDNRGGFAFRTSGAAEDGYYVELRPSSKVTNRANGNEITLYSRKSREWKVLSAGVPLPIAEGIWYDIDASIDTSGPHPVISVWLNGMLVAKATVTNDWTQPNSAKMSMYARGRTAVGFEYIYGVNDGAITPENGYGFWDLKYGGVRGGSWERMQVWQTGWRWARLPKFDLPDWANKGGRIGKYKYKKNLFFFDEFGPYVHEVREFDVKLDPAPVQYSELYSTNTWYARDVDYFANPFTANFTIANIGRVNAVLHGEDALTYGPGDGTVKQTCVVLGRDLTIADDEVVEAKDEAGIRRRGIIETELTSDWIQSKALAETLSEWIVKHWGKGVDEVSVEVFGNPLFEIGDVVAVEYSEKSMTAATHKYFVTGTKSDFSNGIGTTLTLRRVYTTVQYDSA